MYWWTWWTDLVLLLTARGAAARQASQWPVSHEWAKRGALLAWGRYDRACPPGLHPRSLAGRLLCARARARSGEAAEALALVWPLPARAVTRHLFGPYVRLEAASLLHRLGRDREALDALAGIPPDTPAFVSGLRLAVEILSGRDPPSGPWAVWLAGAAQGLPWCALRARARALAVRLARASGLEGLARRLERRMASEDVGALDPSGVHIELGDTGSGPAPCRGLVLAGAYDAAADCLMLSRKKMRRLSRRAKWVRRLLGRLLAIRGDCARLHEVLEPVETQPWAAELERNCLRRRGRWDLVASRCRRLGRRAGPADWFQCARDWMVARDYSKALEAAQRARGIRAEMLRAYLLYRLRRLDAAQAAYARLAGRLEKVDGVRASRRLARVLYWRARALAILGRRREAEGLWRRVVRLDRLGYFGLLARRRLGWKPRVSRMGSLSPPPAVLVPRRAAALARRCGLCLPCRRAVWLAALGLRGEARAELWSVLVRHPIAGPVPRSTGSVAACGRRRAVLRRAQLLLGLPVSDAGHAPEFPFARAVRGLPVSWAMGVARVESAFSAFAVSRVGAQGLMQIMPRTARRILAAMGDTVPLGDRAFDAETNVALGSWYLSHLVEAFGCFVLALAAYNVGPERMDSFLRRAEAVQADEFMEEFPVSAAYRYVRRAVRWAASYAVARGEPVLSLVCLRLPKKWRKPRF